MAVEDVTAQALCGIMEKSLIAEGAPPAMARILAVRACQPVVRKGAQKALSGAKAAGTKTKRAATKYQRRFGVELKRLKAKHTQTPVTRLMKRAHAATKKAMK